MRGERAAGARARARRGGLFWGALGAGVSLVQSKADTGVDRAGGAGRADARLEMRRAAGWGWGIACDGMWAAWARMPACRGGGGDARRRGARVCWRAVLAPARCSAKPGPGRAGTPVVVGRVGSRGQAGAREDVFMRARGR